MLPDPVPIGPLPAALVLAAPVWLPPVWLPPVWLPPVWLPPVWLPPVSLEVGEPVPDGLEVDGLVLVGVDVGVVALAVFVGAGVVEVWHGFVVASAIAVAVAVAVAVAESVVAGLLVAVRVGLTVAVGVGVGVAVLVAVVLSLGLTVLSAGLPLVPLVPLVPLAGLGAEPAGVALGEADLVTSCEGDGEGLGHVVTFALAWLLLLGKLLGLGLPAGVPIC